MSDLHLLPLNILSELLHYLSSRDRGRPSLSRAPETPIACPAAPPTPAKECELKMTEPSFATCYRCGAHMELDLMTGETVCPKCGWIAFRDWPDEEAPK